MDISIMGSTGFLLIFAVVNAANARLHEKTDSRRCISIIGSVICLVAFITLILHGESKLSDMFILAGMIGGSFIIEIIYRTFTGREIKSKS